jgi:hypothetical protein
MFRNASVAEPVEIEQGDSGRNHDADLVPLSHLELDLPAPPIGWAAGLAEKAIDIVTDDLGRLAVSRADARRLFEEKREAEQRAREMAERNERQAILRDQEFRRRLHKGTPWHQMPAGALPAAVVLQQARDAEPKRLSPLQEALAGESLTFHPLPSSGDE